MSKKQSSDAVRLPSLLGYKRSIEPTQFAMYALLPKQGYAGLQSLSEETAKLLPVAVSETTVRGTIANYAKEAPQDRVGVAKNAIDGANIQRIESAFLPVNASVLLVRGAVRFAGHAFEPAMHDCVEFVGKVQDFLSVYRDGNNFQELALRYVLNLACGRWLWRNWQGDDLQVRLTVRSAGLDVVLKEGAVDMSKGFSLDAVCEEHRDAVRAIVSRVADSLSGTSKKSTVVQVSASVDMGPGAEVYPSQEFSTADEKGSSEEVGKRLAVSVLSDGTRQAVLHPQKVGNAVRTIDTWHGQDGVGPIAVEPFGANTHLKCAYRTSGNDLYTYFKNPGELLASASAGVDGRHHFVVACLIRGGAYQMGSGKDA